MSYSGYYSALPRHGREFDSLHLLMMIILGIILGLVIVGVIMRLTESAAEHDPILKRIVDSFKD